MRNFGVPTSFIITKLLLVINNIFLFNKTVDIKQDQHITEYIILQKDRTVRTVQINTIKNLFFKKRLNQNLSMYKTINKY